MSGEIVRFQQPPVVGRAVDVLDRDGAIIIEGLADRPTMDDLEAELRPSIERTPNGEGLFFGLQTKRMGRLFQKSRTARGFATHPDVLPIVETILRRYCSAIQINLTQAIRIEPGERRQILHNDDEFFPVERRPGMEFMINALWAVSDFTRENGATRLLLGSHQKRINRDVVEEDLAVAEMPRGSLLIYLGSALHGGGANVSPAPRTGIVISYCLGWLRQAENQYLAYPPEVAKTFPFNLQRLIGYQIHQPNLGWYEGQDPAILLKDIRPEYLAAQDNQSPEMAAHVARRYRAMGG
jgi:ectoine hydroxylase-related dioxygenase (phytanoyl-CoA dioxygenase family)